jgi:hypothetical protein
MRYLTSFELDAGGGGGPGGFKGDWESRSFGLFSAALLSPVSSFLLVLEGAGSAFCIGDLLWPRLASLELPVAGGELDGAGEVGKLPVDCRVRPPGLRPVVLVSFVNVTSLLPWVLRLSVGLGVAGTDAACFSCRGFGVVAFNDAFGFDDDSGGPVFSCRFAAAPFDDDGLAEILSIASERHVKHKYFASIVILLTSSSCSM